MIHKQTAAQKFARAYNWSRAIFRGWELMLCSENYTVSNIYPYLTKEQTDAWRNATYALVALNKALTDYKGARANFDAQEDNTNE